MSASQRVWPINGQGCYTAEQEQRQAANKHLQDGKDVWWLTALLLLRGVELCLLLCRSAADGPPPGLMCLSRPFMPRLHLSRLRLSAHLFQNPDSHQAQPPWHQQLHCC